MKKRRRLESILRLLSNKNLWISLSFFVCAFLMPWIVNVENLKIYDSLYLSIENNDQGLLIITSFKLVLMNAIRILPVYMASFTFAELMKDYFLEKRQKLVILMGMMLIPISYFLIDLFLNVRYDFGVTSMFMMIIIFALVVNDFSRISLVKKAAFVILIIIGLQWVDIIPSLTSYGFGRGEVSFDVKQAARFMNAEEAMTFAAILFVTIFVFNALMVLKLLKDQNKTIQTLEENAKMEIELREIKLQSLRARSLEEMQNLVHDLKSPLTSIQALVSLSDMMVEDNTVSGYMKKIIGSVDQLNVMITEILHENKRHKTCIEDLMRSVLSHLSNIDDDKIITFDNQLGLASIKINKIRFTRMIINLINNSLNSLGVDGRIVISIFENTDYICFEINDNGKGIEPDQLEKIREPGFSTSGSSGIGLRYVETVINNHHGTFRIDSKVNVGTRVILTLDKERVKYEKDISNR